MSHRPRAWFDVSYTRTQQGGDIGITRTVRRLYEELQRAGFECEPVAFHSSGFRRVAPLEGGRGGAQPSARSGWLFRFITGGLMRQLVPLLLRAVPWHWLHGAWRRWSRRAFDSLAADAQATPFEPGDFLVMADASWNYAAWEAARRARERGAKVVLLVYDLMPLRHPEFCFPLVPRLYGTWLAEMLRNSDAVACISRATQDDVRAWAGECQPPIELAPIGHFRLGSDPGTAQAKGPVRPAIADFLMRPGSCFAAVGSFEPKKNYGVVLRAFELLWARGETPRLIIAGRPTTDCAQLIEAMSRHSQQGRLLLTVHDASDSEVVALYEQCRALVLASLFEGFGLPLVEARTRGCPVIASDLPVFAELADGGVTQFDPRSADALAAQVESHQQDDRRALTAPMPSFTWADSAAQFAHLMRTLPEEAPPSRRVSVPD